MNHPTAPIAHFARGIHCIMLIALALVVHGRDAHAAGDAPKTRPAARAATRPAATTPVDDPRLPRVLIIGDSISLGYTTPVRAALQGKANVHRPPGNCQHTGVGLEHIKAWLGDGRWDVIHFNWGIWDTHMLDTGTGKLVSTPAETKAAPGSTRVRHTPEQYRANLTKLVEIMQATGARLVWASTTPITSRQGERREVIAQYNQIAAQVMKKHGVQIDDLHAAVAPEPGKWQGGDGVHFTAAGSAMLAQQVSQSILEALAKRAPATRTAK